MLEPILLLLIGIALFVEGVIKKTCPWASIFGTLLSITGLTWLMIIIEQ